MECVREVNRRASKCIIHTRLYASSFSAVTELNFLNTPSAIARPVLNVLGHQLQALTVLSVRSVSGIALPKLHTLVVCHQPVDVAPRPTQPYTHQPSRRKSESWLVPRFGVDTAEPGSTPLHTIVDCRTEVAPGNEGAAQTSNPRMIRKRVLDRFDDSGINDDDIKDYCIKRMYGNMIKRRRMQLAIQPPTTGMLKPQYQVVETFIPPAAGTGILAPQLTSVTIIYADPVDSEATKYPFKLPPGLPYHQVKELTLVDAQLECWADLFLLELPEVTRLRLVDAQALETWRVADDRIAMLVAELRVLERITGPAASGLLTERDVRGTIPIPFWCVMPQLKQLSIVQTNPDDKPFPLYGTTLYLLDDAFPVLENINLIVTITHEMKIDNEPVIAECLALLDQMRCRPQYEHQTTIDSKRVTVYNDTSFVDPNTEHKATFRYAAHSIAVSCKMMRPNRETWSADRRRSMRGPLDITEYNVLQCNCVRKSNTVTLEVPKINKTHRQDAKVQ